MEGNDEYWNAKGRRVDALADIIRENSVELHSGHGGIIPGVLEEIIGDAVTEITAIQSEMRVEMNRRRGAEPVMAMAVPMADAVPPPSYRGRGPPPSYRGPGEPPPPSYRAREPEPEPEHVPAPEPELVPRALGDPLPDNFGGVQVFPGADPQWNKGNKKKKKNKDKTPCCGNRPKGGLKPTHKRKRTGTLKRKRKRPVTRKREPTRTRKPTRKRTGKR
jgi:hypothetical protein